MVYTGKFLLKEEVPVYGWTTGVLVDQKAIEQLRTTAKMRVIYHHIAVMPDVHWGCGSTVGSVIPTLSAIIPASVGVDIGCGMMAVKTNLHANDLPDNLAELRSAIEAGVPHGRTDNGGVNDRGAWFDVNANQIGLAKFQAAPVKKSLRRANKHEPGSPYEEVDVVDEEGSLAIRLMRILEKHKALGRAAERAPHHIGTLGTGNHFIELCLDENNDVWVMLHSGSRGIGNKIGTYFIEKAKEDMRKWHINLPDADLSYFPEGTDHFNDYVEGVLWAQEFAMANRETMMANVLRVLKAHFPQLTETSEMAVNCHHNYVQKEHHFGKNVWLTRKGAVRARDGDLGIIPGSMGARSFIVRGKGNAESFNSCSHGAGRVMSRSQAHKQITLSQHVSDTEGVECKKDASVIDESPRAYKNIDAVMKAQDSLVDIVHTLKQVLCVKG